MGKLRLTHKKWWGVLRHMPWARHNAVDPLGERHNAVDPLGAVGGILS